MTWPARAERAGKKKLWEISMEQLEIISGGDLPRAATTLCIVLIQGLRID